MNRCQSKILFAEACHVFFLLHRCQVCWPCSAASSSAEGNAHEVCSAESFFSDLLLQCCVCVALHAKTSGIFLFSGGPSALRVKSFHVKDAQVHLLSRDGCLRCSLPCLLLFCLWSRCQLFCACLRFASSRCCCSCVERFEGSQCS